MKFNEIHIRDPQWDHIGGSEFLFPLIVFGRMIVSAVDHFVKVVLHGSGSFRKRYRAARMPALLYQHPPA